MDKQKVEQALREIFDRCGEDMVQNHSKFKSAVFDMLDEINYSDERMVFRHAMDSKAFWILLESPNITEESVKKAAAQIQKESHMTKEDTEFVLQCVAAVRGSTADIATAGEELQQDVQPIMQQEVQEIEPQENQKELPAKMGDPVLDVECRMIVRGKKSLGKMFLYQNGLMFVPYIKDKKQGRRIYRMDTNKDSAIEIFYQNIEAFYFMKKWVCVVCSFLLALMLLFGGFIGLLVIAGAAWWYLSARKRIKMKLSMEIDKISFLFQSYADKKKILSILQK